MFGFFTGARGNDRRLMKGAFAAAEATPDPMLAMLHLLGACGSPDAAVAGRAGRELARRLGEVPLDRLAAFDERIRRTLQVASYAPARLALPRWIVDRDAVGRVRLSGEAALPALAILSMHPSGYVRDDAVAALAAQEDGAELPYLLLRANDWVEPIRRRVWQVLHGRFPPRFAAAWVRLLPLLMRLEDARRGEYGPVVVRRVLDELAERPECRPALMAGLASADRVVRRTCFRTLARASKPADAVRIGLANDDPVVRLQAAREVERLKPDELAAIVPVMLLDRFVAVRTVAAIFAERAGDLALLRAAALDASATPRGIAAAGLARRGMDVAALYRAAVDGDERTQVGAVAGLGERGAAADAETVARFLEHAQGRVRAAAVEAYARLAREEALPILARMLGDAAPSVSRAAMRALERRRMWVDPATLEALYAPASPPHVRKNALRLMSRRGRWTGIVPVLRALCDEDARIADAARRHLRRWAQLQRSAFASPTAEEHERFRDALDQHGGCISDPALAAQLRAFR